MLGIDIGSYAIKAVVAKKSGKKLVIEQVASEVLPFDSRGEKADVAVLQSIISRLIKQIGKGQSTVALSVPTSSVILKTILADAKLNDAMLEGEVQLELVNLVPFPLDQIYADYQSLGISKDNPDKQEVFVAASRRDVVDKVANMVKAKSIRKKEIEIEAFAMGQVLEQLKGEGYSEAYAVIDIGHTGTTVGVFQAGDMLFNREQQIGGYHLTEAIAEEKGLETTEAEEIKHQHIASVSPETLSNYLDSVSEQLAMALEFFTSTSETELTTVYITGGGSMVDGLIDNLSENIPNQSFQRLPIGTEIAVGKKTNGMSQESVRAMTAIAAGLAMRK